MVSKAAFNPNPYTIFEYTRSGLLVQSLTVPFYPEANEGTYNLGMTIDHLGNLHVFDGPTHCGVSDYNADTNTWTTTSLPGFGVNAYAGEGGIGSWGDYAFLPNNGPTASLIRYNTVDHSSVHFGLADEDPLDVTVAPDGLVYCLENTHIPGGDSIRVYDPTSLTLVRTISLHGTSQEVRYMSVRQDGNIVLTDLYNPMFLVDPNGQLLSAKDWSVHMQICDMDQASDGWLAITNGQGHVYLYDGNVNPMFDFEATGNNAFAHLTFVPVPEPMTVVPLLLGVLAFAAHRGKRH